MANRKPGRLKHIAKLPSVFTRKKTTTVTLSDEDLAALARLLAAGQAMLQVRYPVVGRLKAAMTRLGVSTVGL